MAALLQVETSKGVVSSHLCPFLDVSQWMSVASVCKIFLSAFMKYLESKEAAEKYGKGVATTALKQWFFSPFQPSIMLLHQLRKKGVTFGPEQTPELVTQLKKCFVKNERIGIRMMGQCGVDCRPLLPYIFDVSRTYDSGCVIEILLSPSVFFAKGFRGIPFHQYFVLLGKIDYLRLLKKKKKDIDFNYKDRNDQNLACWAVCAPQNELAVLEFLHKECNVDMTTSDKWGVNAALTAVIHKKLDCVRYLVEKCGVDINHTNNDGRTLAHECAERGCDAILAYLIQKGIDLSIKTKTYEKETAYDLANVYLQKKCLELLKPWKQKEQDSETESKQKE